MVHKPGLADHDWDHVPGSRRSRSRSCPEFIRLHEAGGGPRRAVQGGRDRPEHDALPGRRRGARGRRRIAEETGLPAADPVRFGGDGLWPRSATRSTRCRGWRARCRWRRRGSRRVVTLSLRHEVLRLALRDPFRIARSDHDAGHAVTTVVIELRDDRFPASSGSARATRTGSTARRPRRWPRSSRCWSTRSRASSRPRDGVRARRARRLQAAIRWNGAAKCAIDTAIHDLAGKVTGAPGPRAARAVGRTSRRRTSPSGSTSPPSSRSARARAAASRRSRSSSAARPTSRRSRPSARSTTSRSASTRTPAGRPRSRGSCCRRWSTSASSSSSSRSRPGGSTGCATSRPARRCRSSPTSRA